MDEAKVASELKAAKAEFEAKAKPHRDKIDRAKRTIQRSESKLARLTERLEKRTTELTRSYLDLPVAEDPQEPRRRRRGSLDEPMLKLIQAMPVGLITIPAVCDEWNRQNPEGEMGQSTVRGVLERLEASGRLILDEPGGKGRSKATTYRLPEVRMPGAEEGNTTTN